MNYTLSYSEGVAGWVSFYSYFPDWMIGMNNYFYTFKGGDLYRHNATEVRNTFYQPWWDKVDYPIVPSPKSFTPSLITSVFNNAVLENKIFKTINLEGDSTWDATLVTDIQSSGYILAPWFEKKEASYYAFVRNNSNGEFALRSLNGIGSSIIVDYAGSGAAEVNFSINPLISIGSIISVGDYLYFDNANPKFAGIVIDVIVDLPAGINKIIVNNDMLIPLSIKIPSDVNYFFYVKNSVAESHGVLGHYCTFTLQNDSNAKIELFAVETEAMKSFP